VWCACGVCVCVCECPHAAHNTHTNNTQHTYTHTLSLSHLCIIFIHIHICHYFCVSHNQQHGQARCSLLANQHCLLRWPFEIYGPLLVLICNYDASSSRFHV
jgi:hypothetical protein